MSILGFIFNHVKAFALGSLTSVVVAIFWFAVRTESTQATVQAHGVRITALETRQADLENRQATMDGKLDTLLQFAQRNEERQLRHSK